MSWLMIGVVLGIVIGMPLGIWGIECAFRKGLIKFLPW